MMTLNRRERARMRLAAQGLTAQRWHTAAEAVRAFGVTQGQDLHSVRRSLALRATDESDKSEIVRGYAMRNTLFAASVKDMGWITELCAKPRKGDAAVREAVLQLIDAPLTRAELKARAARALPELPFWHVVRIAMESGHACYVGEEQLITPVELDGLEALFNGDSVAATTELMTRYFRTHGPATLQDFAWWSKLPQKLIRPVAENLPDDLIRIGREGEELVSTEVLELPEVRRKKSVLLLGAFDEYILGYQDRLLPCQRICTTRSFPGTRAFSAAPSLLTAKCAACGISRGLRTGVFPPTRHAAWNGSGKTAEKCVKQMRILK